MSMQSVDFDIDSTIRDQKAALCGPPCVFVFSVGFLFCFWNVKPKRPFLRDLQPKPHHTTKSKKGKKSKDFQECVGPGLSSEALVVFVCLFQNV